MVVCMVILARPFSGFGRVFHIVTYFGADIKWGGQVGSAVAGGASGPLDRVGHWLTTFVPF